MPIEIDRYENASQAMEAMDRKGVLPTALSSRDAREQISQRVRQRSVWSARTTNAEYVSGLRKELQKYLAGEQNLGTMRSNLKLMLRRMGYSPKKGFPGDASLGIPPAKPGSLRDLSSDRRIRLIIDTQISLVRNAALKARGMEPDRMELYPAWELVRVESRRVPRGSDKSAGIGWQRRWLECGGPILKSGRLVALKTDPVWSALGDSSRFDDALDIDTPPFAFGSGMGWKEVREDEALDLGLTPATRSGGPKDTKADILPPPPVHGVKTLGDPELDALLKSVRAERAEKPGYIRMQEILDSELDKARRAYPKP